MDKRLGRGVGAGGNSRGCVTKAGVIASSYFCGAASANTYISVITNSHGGRIGSTYINTIRLSLLHKDAIWGSGSTANKDE